MRRKAGTYGSERGVEWGMYAYGFSPSCSASLAVDWPSGSGEDRDRESEGGESDERESEGIVTVFG